MSDPHPALRYEIPDAEFVVCDIETTGLSPERSRITEIALVRVAELRPVERFETLVNPRQFITREIEALTGITNAMVYGAPPVEDVLPRVRAFVGDAVFVGHNARFDRSFVDAALERAGIDPLANPTLCTARLARRLTPQLGRKSLDAIARHLGIRIARRHRAGGDAEATAGVLVHFLRTLAEEFDVRDVAELLSFQHRPVYRVTGAPAHHAALRPALDALPHEPGVYVFRDRRKTPIYVGKARNLRERVHSYFTHNVGHSEKVRRLVKMVRAIEWTTTETELSALLLEARTVRRHQPRFNTMLKSARKYPFITVDRSDPFPRAGWSYDIDDDGREYFGPFSSRFAVERALEVVDRMFLLRECEGPLRPRADATPCLYYDIKRCGAPCAELQSHAEYLDEVHAVELFLLGRHDDALDRLRAAMERKAEALAFEAAAELRDRIGGIERLTLQQRTMVRSIRRQNLVIVTPARGTRVEVHCIRNGMLARQALVDQREARQPDLRKAVEETFFSGQSELFPAGVEDVNEMRIIATWCLTRRDESIVVDIEAAGPLRAAVRAVLSAVRRAGKSGAGTARAAAG